MELFLPSLLVLLIAAAVVFYALPQFGPATLAVLSLALLVFGVYQHINTFGAEYRLSTWQMSFSTFTPFIMLGGIFFVIAIYFLFITPASEGATAVEMPTISKMPSAESATNAITKGINTTLKTASEALGLGNNNNSGNANKGEGNKGNGSSNKGNRINNNNNNANENNNSYIQQMMEKLGMGKNNNGKVSNNLKKPNVSGEPRMVPGLPYPLSQP